MGPRILRLRTSGATKVPCIVERTQIEGRLSFDQFQGQELANLQSRVTRQRLGLSLLPPAFLQHLDRASQVRYGYRSAYYQSYVEGLEKLCIGDLLLDALDYVVGDTVIATKNERGDESHQLFGLPGKRAIIVSLGIQVEEAFDLKVSFCQNFLVHFLPISFEFFEGVAVARHFRAHLHPDSSPGIRMWAEIFRED